MTTKKLLSIILSLVMLLSVLSVTASAADNVLKPYERVSVTASESTNPVFTFVSEETVTYKLTSYAPDEIDPYCYVQTEDGEVDETFDDSDFGYNFSDEFEFEAGVVYYITVLTYSEEEATFDIALNCVHKWDENTCEYCKKVCDHDVNSTGFMTCECGKVSETPVIELGETVTVFDMTGDYAVKFIPDEDVTAILSSNVYTEESQYDVSAKIYDSEYEEIASNDDFADSYDFVILYEFTAGETYFFKIHTYYEGLDVVFSLERAVHTTDAGEEHALVYVDATWGSCVEHEYSEGLYCEECDEYILGHIEGDYGFCQDDDWDGFCDFCGAEIEYEEETEMSFFEIIEVYIIFFITYIIDLIVNGL